MKTKKELTAEEMTALAEEQSQDNHNSAMWEREDDWVRTIDELNLAYFYIDDDDKGLRQYAQEEIFHEASNYFKNRTADLLKHHYSNYAFDSTKQIVAILSFDFHYHYTWRAWDEQGYDPDLDPFYDNEESSELEGAAFKLGVCEALKNFILNGGALAKSINSDTYALWRKLLVKYTYDFREFNDGADADKVRQFLYDLQQAGQLTYADFAFIDAKKRLSQITPLKAKKRPKK